MLVSIKPMTDKQAAVQCCVVEVDVSQCRVSGRGIQPTGLRVDDRAVFQVSTPVYAAQTDLDVTVSRSTHGGPVQEPVRVVKVSHSLTLVSVL